MPTVNILKDELYRRLGVSFTDSEFEELCFEYGLELDEITSEKQMLQKEQGSNVGADASDDIIFKVEVAANRYDLLCVEGLSRALAIYLGKASAPTFKRIVPAKPRKLIVRSPAEVVRPFCVAAILRDITFNKDRLKSFIELQDKLHGTLCRKRSLVSMGTHDLDKMTAGDVIYTAKPPGSIQFVPLKESKSFSAEELMAHYSGESHLKQYLPILEGKSVYPVVEDSEGVMSWPPIINSERTKITVDTRNVFIEITATDCNKAETVLDVLCTMFSEYCKDKFTSEVVEVVYETTHPGNPGNTVTYPLLKERVDEADVDYICTLVGVKMTAQEICKLLERIAYSSKPSADGKKVLVTIPPTRPDVLHACDIAEDVAVAYGFNKVPKKLPSSFVIAKQFPLNQFTDLVRQMVAMAGFTEALTFSLCSRDDIGKNMRKSIEKLPAVHVSNPKTLEFQVVRTSLIPGLLKCIASNRNMPLPLRIFEISDVVFKTDQKDVGATNRRYLAAVFYGKTTGFEQIHGLLDRIMQILDIPWAGSDAKSKKKAPYSVKNGDGTL